MSKNVEVTIIHRGSRDVDGTIHRRRVTVGFLTAQEPCVPVTPVEERHVSHQCGGDLYKSKFHFPRGANHLQF